MRSRGGSAAAYRLRPRLWFVFSPRCALALVLEGPVGTRGHYGTRCGLLIRSYADWRECSNSPRIRVVSSGSQYGARGAL